jgi:hypothetical protein
MFSAAYLRSMFEDVLASGILTIDKTRDWTKSFVNDGAVEESLHRMAVFSMVTGPGPFAATFYLDEQDILSFKMEFDYIVAVSTALIVVMKMLIDKTINGVDLNVRFLFYSLLLFFV